MKHITVNFDFKSASLKPNPSKLYSVDTKIATDVGREVELGCFILSFYNSMTLHPWEDYQQLITAAIIYNNLTSVEILWKGTYRCGGYNPDYCHDLYTAAEFGNLQTFQHVLYACANYNTLDGVDPIKYYTLRSKAVNNMYSDVLKYVEALEDCVLCGELVVVSKKELSQGCDMNTRESELEEYSLDDSTSDDDDKRLLLGEKLYEITESFKTI